MLKAWAGIRTRCDASALQLATKTLLDNGCILQSAPEAKHSAKIRVTVQTSYTKTVQTYVPVIGGGLLSLFHTALKCGVVGCCLVQAVNELPAVQTLGIDT